MITSSTCLGRQRLQRVNRTLPVGVHAKTTIAIRYVLHNSIAMSKQSSTFNNNNLTQLLSQRLDLWDQQDAAKRDGALHQALSLEQHIRQLNDEIRQALALDAMEAEVGQ